MDQPIFNQFPGDNNQQSPVPQKRPGSRFPGINWAGIVLLVIAIVVIFVVIIAIRDLSSVLGCFGATVIGWVKDATIFPQDKRGLTLFMRLLLTGGFIWIVFLILKQK
jgi:hypothetical protein